jgi:hypothetical protein
MADSTGGIMSVPEATGAAMAAKEGADRALQLLGRAGGFVGGMSAQLDSYGLTTQAELAERATETVLEAENAFRAAREATEKVVNALKHLSAAGG